MANQKYRASALWNDIIKNHFGDISTIDLTNFRNNVEHTSLNTRISAWSINTNSLRFYKNLLFNEAKRLSDEQIQIIDGIRIRDLGNPVTVRIRGRPICIDYLQAASEVDFMSETLGQLNSVLEIGAGFGRTCHAVLENFAQIDHYCIVDLPQCLRISRKYLEAVLTAEQFAKIRFISNDEVEGDFEEQYGIGINIDSMSEMDAETVDNYLSLISRRCQFFYAKNPLGKYLPETIGVSKPTLPSTRMAMEMGKLTDIIDIFDDEEIADSIPTFLSAYKPNDDWQIAAHAWAPPWSYYYQVLFQKNSKF